MTSIVFFGTGPVAAASLEYIRSIFNIEAVITKPRVAGFKGLTPVEDLAKKYRVFSKLENKTKSKKEIIKAKIPCSNFYAFC